MAFSTNGAGTIGHQSKKKKKKKQPSPEVSPLIKKLIQSRPRTNIKLKANKTFLRKHKRTCSGASEPRASS